MNENLYQFMFDNQAITITLCDQAENHVGMQKLGNKSEIGFGLSDLLMIKQWFDDNNIETELIDLNYPIENLNIYPDDEAYILIIKNGVDCLLGPVHDSGNLFDELKGLEWDKKAFMYGRVVNKHARHNLCFGPNSQDADYESGNGTIIAFNDVCLLKIVRNKLQQIIGDKFNELVAEGNYYYDISQCGIGFHGDSERRLVIGVRLGETIPLEYQWYYNSKPVGERMSVGLSHGDIYFMSEKATGNDWKKKLIHTLRHAAGADKFL